MGTFKSLFGGRKKETDDPPVDKPPQGIYTRKRCDNCGALLLEIDYQENKGLCGQCSEKPSIAEKRRQVAESINAFENGYPACGGCGATEDQRKKMCEEAVARGMGVYLRNNPSLLFCESCGKFFCGACQIDLSISAGCPRCRKELV